MSDPFTEGLRDHRRLAEWLPSQVPLLRAIGELLIEALAAERRVYVCGNGGSAADAQHIAAELIGRFKHDRRALPVVALTTDTSALLSIANDYGFEQVFARQVEGLVRPGDVVWTLSTSGNSPNVLRAARAARERQARVIGFTGRGGGQLAPLCDLCFCVDHETSDRIQEIHQVAYHLLCDLVEEHFRTR